MRTFAISMTALMALLLGGGFYAYRAGVAEPAKAEASTGSEEASAEAAAEGTGPGGLSTEGSSDDGTGADRRAEGTQDQGAEGGQEGAVAEGEAQESGASEGTEATQAAGEEGATGATTRGDNNPGEGSTNEANRINESTPSQNQTTGRVPGGEAEVQAASVQGDPGKGKVLYEANCQGCHATNGKGQVGPSLVGATRPANWEFAQFTKVLYDGIDPNGNLLEATMPRYRRSSLQPDNEPADDQKLADIQSYLKTLPE